jgi:hypothetical protein
MEESGAIFGRYGKIYQELNTRRFFLVFFSAGVFPLPINWKGIDSGHCGREVARL